MHSLAGSGVYGGPAMTILYGLKTCWRDLTGSSVLKENIKN